MPLKPYYLRPVACALLAYLLGIQLSGWFFFVPVAIGGHADFRHLYTAGYMVRTGHARQLYDYEAQKAFQDKIVSPEEVALPFNHLAYEALLYAPLSFLTYRTAYFVFLAVNIGFLVASLWLLRPHLGRLAEFWRPLPMAMAVCFLPIGVALMEGQDSVLLLLLCSCAYVGLLRGRDFAAGLLVGLGLFKFQIVLPVAALFLVWKRWRFAAGFTFSAAAVTAVSLWLVGPAQLMVYARSLVSMSVALASRVDRLKYGVSPTAMPNLRGLISGLGEGRIPTPWIQAATVALSGLVLLWVAASAPRKRGGADALLLAITASMVVSYHVLTHDLSVLLIPIGVTLNRFLGVEVEGRGRDLLAAGAAALLFMTPGCLPFLREHFYLASLPLLFFLFVLRSGREV